MPKRPAAQSRFPKTVYVTFEEDQNDEDGGYLAVTETPDGATDGQRVAVYELRELKTKRVTHAIE